MKPEKRIPKEIVVQEVPLEIDLGTLPEEAEAVYDVAVGTEILTLEDYEHALPLVLTARNIQDKIKEKFAPYESMVKQAKQALEEAAKGLKDIQSEHTRQAVAAEAVLKQRLLGFIEKHEEYIKDPHIIVKQTWKFKASGEPLDPEFLTVDEYGFPIPDYKKIQAGVSLMKEQTNIRGVTPVKSWQIAIKGEKE